jgi:hypothetical protein
MNPTSFKFPPRQAVSLADFVSRLMAVVAPALTPGTHYVGVLQLIEIGEKLLMGDFISGPACVLTKHIWRKLATMPGGDAWDSANPSIYPMDHDFSIPTRSLDDFIDILTGGQAQ